MKKQLLILTLMCLSILGHSQTFIDNFIEYQVISSTPPYTVQITDYDYTNGGAVVNIPSTVTNNSIAYSVVVIGDEAFLGNLTTGEQITSVSIPNSVTFIGYRAFQSNLLTSVIIPDSVTQLSNLSFGENPLLASVTLSNNLTDIAPFSFVSCALTSVIIPDSVTAIQSNAFSNNQLTSVIIPSNVITVATRAFFSNPFISVTLESNTPPAVVTPAGPNTSTDSFGNRSNIDLFVPTGTTNAYLSGGWTGFNSVTETGAAQVGDTFVDSFITYEITSLTPDTVEAIDYDVAGGTVVNIPNIASNNGIDFEVTAIGSSAFNDKNLTEVSIPNSVLSTSFQSFANNQLTSIVIPDSVTAMGNSTFQNNQLTSVVISNNVVTLGSLIFANNQLTNIIIPNGISTIADLAFFNNALTNVTLPSSVNIIAGGAFRNNPLASVTSESTTPPTIITGGTNDSFSSDRSGIDLIIPIGTTGVYVTDPGALWTGFNSVTETGAAQVGDTFVDSFITYEITSLTPDTVEAIDYDMAGGTVVNIPASVSLNVTTYSVTSIGYDAFENKGLTSVIIPNSIVDIGHDAFNVNNLTSISIPNSVIIIQSGAFANNQLNSLTIPNNVTSIGVSAFVNNQINGSLTIPNSVTVIDGSAFLNNSLTDVIIGNNVTSIGFAAFNNNNLNSITIPNSVTNIGAVAFRNNPLANVYSESLTPPTITTGLDDSFSDDRSTIHLHIPGGTMDVYVTNPNPGAFWTGFNPVTEDALSISDFELANNIKVISTANDIQIVSQSGFRLENYTIYNITGAKVSSSNESIIATSTFAKGIYIIKLDFDRGIITKKIVIN